MCIATIQLQPLLLLRTSTFTLPHSPNLSLSRHADRQFALNIHTSLNLVKFTSQHIHKFETASCPLPTPYLRKGGEHCPQHLIDALPAVLCFVVQVVQKEVDVSREPSFAQGVV